MKVYFPLLLLFPSVSLASAGAFGSPQRPGDKPVLIRDEVDKRDERKEPVHDPKQARKSAGIGDFYYRRDNLRAAAQRYREAIDFDVHWAESYDKLIRVLRRQGELEEADAVCRRFLAENPESKEAAKFESLCVELARESAAQPSATSREP
jgi:tetratricopeptide (TPR) repeat protein